MPIEQHEPAMLLTRLRRAARGSPTPAAAAPRRSLPWRAWGGASVQMPPPATPALTVDQVLRRRHAVRQFDEAPISLQALAAMLRVADRGLTAPSKDAVGPKLDLLVLAQRVAGLAPALYLYSASAHALLHLATLTPADDLCSMVRQEEFAAAAALVLALGDLDAAVTRHGARGYTLILLEAGAALHRVWLTAVSLGLAGCLFEGLMAAPLRRLTGDQHAGLTPLLACAVGVAAGAAEHEGTGLDRCLVLPGDAGHADSE